MRQFAVKLENRFSIRRCAINFVFQTGSKKSKSYDGFYDFIL